MNREDLILENDALVFFICKKIMGDKWDEDIVQTGRVGLVRAANTFDESKNYMFSTYAYKCIKNEILLYLRYKNTKWNESQECSLNETIYVSSDGDEIALQDVLASDVDLEKSVCDNVQFNIMLNCVEQLPDAERNAIKKYYGIGCKRLKQHEIIKQTGKSQSYTSRLIRRAERMLRFKMMGKGLLER